MNDPRSARDAPHKADDEVADDELLAARAARRESAKPSPREALRAVVEELMRLTKQSQDEARQALSGSIYDSRITLANKSATRAGALIEAITLIRSMAGHLMEGNTNES